MNWKPHSPYTEYFSSEKLFASTYLSFLFEERIRPYIITSIRNYIIRCNINPTLNSFSSFIAIFICILKDVEMELPRTT